MNMCFYFGCWNQPGHYLHDKTGCNLRGVGPFRDMFDPATTLDTRYAPGVSALRAAGRRFDIPANQDEHETARYDVDGWTVLAMWDRSVDTRGGCNAAFIAEGPHTDAEMWMLARRDFPRIVARLKVAGDR